MQDEGSITPSLKYAELSSMVPRLLPGQLIARHVSEVGEGETASCDWCGEQLQTGQQWMLDVYEQPGFSKVPLTIGGKQQLFRKTALLRVHATCVTQVCSRAVQDFISKVKFCRQPVLHMSDDEMHARVWKHCRWAVRWVSWHHQFIADEPIELHIACKNEQLVQTSLPAFYLAVQTQHAPGQVLAPVTLFTSAFIESLYTRVYQYDLVYRGKYQPLAQLRGAFAGSELNTDLHDCNVAAFAHMVLDTSWSSNNVDEQHIRLIAKVRPSAQHMHALREEYKQNLMQEGVSWTEIHQHVQASHSVASSWQADADNLLQRTLAQDFHKVEKQLDALLASVDMKPTQGKPLAFDISKMELVQTHRNHAMIICVSNCYMPRKDSQNYYFFRESYNEADQPLFCYTGKARGLLPIIVTSPVLLSEELKDAGVTETKLPQLTVLMSHISDIPRACKRD